MIQSNTWKVNIGILLPLMLLAQTENWVYRHNGPGDDIAFSIVYGADDNIYAAGHSDAWGDLMVISLTTAGDTNWVYQYNGPGNDRDVANSIVYGTDGNIYAAGQSWGSGTNDDFAVVSLSSTGDTNWVYRYNGPGNYADIANSIAYGADGNIYVAGGSHGVGTDLDFIVISLTTAGDTNWVYRYNGQGNFGDGARSIVYGADDNIYAAGFSRGSSTTCFTVISLTTTGDTNWVYQDNGQGSADAKALVYGGDGNIYAAGYSWNSGTGRDFTVISLTTAGDTNWVYRYDGQGADDDIAYSLAYGADGNIYATGVSHEGSTSRDFIVISLTTAGDTNWVYRYNGPESESDGANSIVYGADDNIYAAGYSFEWTYPDFLVVSLTTSGDTNWIYRYDDGPWDLDAKAYSVTYGADGNIYAAGCSWGLSTYNDFTVISLSPDLSVKEKNTIFRENSFGATVFKGSLLLPEDKHCRVFDITGRVVNPNKIKPGIYFIEIDGEITHKVIKIR